MQSIQRSFRFANFTRTLGNLNLFNNTICTNSDSSLFVPMNLVNSLLFSHIPTTNSLHPHKLYSNLTAEEQLVDSITFEKVCEETLESLTDYFEQLVESVENLNSADISYTSGVLTVNLGPNFGTYVINRQSPNRQIWLSSPTSGPKRYDYVVDGGYWVYKHDHKTLHGLLQREISKIVGNGVDFSQCSYAKL